MRKRNLRPIAAAVGTAFVATLATASFASSTENPFGARALDSGYGLMASADAEGKCGEGKCGEDKGGEGSCGEDKGGEGSCGEDKGGEGSCGEDKGGEGKCGGAA
ncbi:MAG: hypothetical protein HC809_10235 [Gammaproteobacteria bacterium]|nr:hypothetical protein [Gammaproteobacteria bacterium]